MNEHEITSVEKTPAEIYENKTLNTIGLLLVIFGLILTIGSLIQGIPLLLYCDRIVDSESFRRFFQEFDEKTIIDLHRYVYTILISIANLNLIKGIISITGIIGGFGILWKREYGITVTKLWAWSALIYLLVDSAIYLYMVIPMMVHTLKIIPIKAFGNLPAGMKTVLSMAKTMLNTMVIITNLILAILPAVTVHSIKRVNSE
jgi:hypothetical protein